MIDKVIAIIERETGEKVHPETLFTDMAIDSLEFLDLVLALEIPQPRIGELYSVADAARILSE